MTKAHIAPETKMICGAALSPPVHRFYQDAYVLPSQSRTDPRISPIFAPMDSFPRHIYCACGNADVFYEPAAKFVQNLKDAGSTDVEFVCGEYMGHGFDKDTKEGSEAEKVKVKAYDGAISMINRTLLSSS